MNVPSRHGPNRLSSYLEDHNAILNQFIAGDFVCGEAIDARDFETSILLEGEIGCLGRIVIAVVKLLNVVDIAADNQRIVQTVQYSYNVSVRGCHTIFRYDNSHSHPGHSSSHHKHEFDWTTGEQAPGSPRCIGDDWPLLLEVIEEARDWYYIHRATLPFPNDCADDLQSEVTR